MGTGYPEYILSYIHDRLTIAVLDGIWHDQRLEYDLNNKLIYKGVNEIHKEADTSLTWEVWKYTYTDGNLTRIEGPLRGSWDGRAALDWA